MRLCRFEIRKFKGIQNASFEWDDIVILIGENNAGKSSVLEALQSFLSGSQIKDEDLFCDRHTDGPNAMELVGSFDQLTNEEKTSPAVRGRMTGDKWIIKKRFWTEGGEGVEGERAWKEQYYSFSSAELIAGWPEPDNTWNAFPEEFQPLIADVPDRGARPNQQTRERLREIVRERRPDLVHDAEPAWNENPGGGGNWKSNANSIMPRLIPVKAVHDATDEAVSKEASAYGKIVSLIVEKKMMQRPEVAGLKAHIEDVLRLFRPNPENPETQAAEIREVEEKINKRLNEVVGGIVSIETVEPDLKPVLLPSTTLMLRDRADAIKTSIGHQGHGLQRSLIMTLLQILAEIQAEPVAPPAGGAAPAGATRAVILSVEEPELYMHPQMERKMRDALYRLASQAGTQVICTTHSPVFLDMAQKHRAIVRVVKDGLGTVSFAQVTAELFDGPTAGEERNRLRFTSRFHPTVNEVFFAKRVVLLEEESAIVAFERGAELLGMFVRHPECRRDVTLIDTRGKGEIPLFQKVLNHFKIPYTVVHDEDAGNPNAATENAAIAGLVAPGQEQNKVFMIRPTNLEGLLGYAAGRNKPYAAIRRVEELHAAGALPPEFIQAVNQVYFGQDHEPA